MRRSFQRALSAFARRTRRQEGAALVEAAFVLPIMLLICVGILEFGRAFQSWQVVTNASREGARVAVLPAYSDESVINRVKTYLKNGGLPAAIVDSEATEVLITATTIDVNETGTITAPAARVEVHYPFEFMVLQPIAQLIVSDSEAGEAFDMVATTIMRNE